MTLFGEPEADAEVLEYVGEVVRGMPGFPRGVEFEPSDGAPRQFANHPRNLPPERAPSARAPSARARPRLGLVGLSVAGADAEYPGIGLWPETIQRLLETVPNRSFDVLYYRSDRERATMSELVGDLVSSDLMLAVVGRKYLYSPYCMVEFLGAARYLQHEETFEKPEVWPRKLWPILLPDATELLARAEGLPAGTKHPSEDWKTHWLKEGAQYGFNIEVEFGGEDAAKKEAPKKYIYDAWMRFARRGKEGLGQVLAALCGFRYTGWQALDPPAQLEEGDRRHWAEDHARPLVEKILKKMEGIVGSLNPDERRERARLQCRRYWEAGHREEAAEAFDLWLDCHPDPKQARKEAKDASKPLNPEELEPVRQHWLHRQGINP